MATITRPAVEIQQGKLKLYLTYVTPEDLLLPDFYTVDKLDIAGQQGFQRLLDERRARELARDLKDAALHEYANLPTTVFLATEGDVDFDANSNQVSFETGLVCPFSVVDGQHRISGLLEAVKDVPQMRDFRLPATIAVSLDSTHQMYHFYTVNTNQKPVDSAVGQEIIARFNEMNRVKPMPYLPKKMERDVVSDVTKLAVDLVHLLNTSDDSPLKGRIQMADQKKQRSHRVNQSSFVNTLKRHVFHNSNDIFNQERRSHPDTMNQIVLNFLCAADELLVGPTNRDITRLYNNNGLYFLALISKWTFQKVYRTPNGKFTVQELKSILQDAFDNLETNYTFLGQRKWWLPSHGAPSLNRALADEYATAYLAGLRASEQANSTGSRL